MEKTASMEPCAIEIARLQVALQALEKSQREISKERDTAQRYLDIAGVILVALNATGNVTLINRKGCELLGYPEDEIVGRPWFDRFLPSPIRNDIHKVFESIMAGEMQLAEFHENPILTRNGEERIIAWHNRALTDEHGKIIGTLSSGEDITERERSDNALKKSNRALRTISAGNTTLVHALNEENLLRDMCRTIIDQGGYRLAWIGFVEHDTEKHIRLAASAGAEPGYLEALQVTWGEDERGQGPVGRAVRLGIPQGAEDIATDPSFSPWRKQALAYGFASSLALPLKENGGRTFGVLNICSAEPYAFDEDEIHLLQELASDLAFGILTLRMRQERDQYQVAHLKNMEHIKETLTDAIRAIALTVEKRDPYTAGHQSRVAQLAAAIAWELGLEEDRIEGIRLGALIHDIGKIYVPAEILSRPGRLTEPEFGIIKTHPKVGYDIVKDVKFPWPVAEMILQHHERLDGSGYPRGLKGDEIILEARILAVADVVEAVTAHRPYRPALGLEAGLAEIEAKRGQLYDARVVDACLRLFREKDFRLEGIRGNPLPGTA